MKFSHNAANMQTLIVYSSFWVFKLLCIFLVWRVLWIKRIIAEFSPISGYLERLSVLRAKNAELFHQSAIFNALFMASVLVSNLIVLLRHPSEILESSETLVAVNINILLLLSTRHSTFLHLCAAAQPNFIWSHQALGYFTVFELILHYCRTYQGKSMSQELANSTKCDQVSQGTKSLSCWLVDSMFAFNI